MNYRPATPKSRDVQAIIERQGAHMSRLIDDLLTFRASFAAR